MKQDNLEKFISDNMADFNNEVPPPMVWMNLEKELNQSKKEAPVYPIKRPGLMRIMQVAAMFVVVMGVGLLIGLQINADKIPYNNPNLKEFVEAERYYNRQIDDMLTVVKANEPQEEISLQEDLQSLDEVYKELRFELMNDGGKNTDAIVNAMIENYRTKIDVLETVLNKYKSNQQINLEDDKVEI